MASINDLSLAKGLTAKVEEACTGLEPGDYVRMLDGELPGNVGIFDNEFLKDGVVTYAVLCEEDPDIFWYVTKIELFQKA
jgi:hypothetical protein